MSLEDDEESGAGSSDNDDQDETMLDADEPEADATQDLDNSMQDQDQDDEDAEDNDEEEEDTQEKEGTTRDPNRASAQQDDRTRDYRTPEHNLAPSVTSPTVSEKANMLKVRSEMISAEMYDIAPTIAAPHSTSINAITSTQDMRWVFSGGADGWIRKFNWVDTVNSKTLLTVAQRHPFVDSVTKAGVLMSYWENEEPSEAKPSSALQDPEESLPLSPVYSLAVHPEALWLLSGTEVGAINLQSVRHQEGKRITSLIKHTSAVSVMQLLSDQRSLLSGSWDKVILEWDLNTGQTKRSFMGSRSQISAIEVRPESSLPIPREPAEQVIPDGFSTNNADEVILRTDEGPKEEDDKAGEDVASPMGSLFGDNGDHNSLFGEDPGGGALFEENDEFSRAIANGIPPEDSQDAPQAETNGITSLADSSNPDQVQLNGALPDPPDPDSILGLDVLPNGSNLPHADDLPQPNSAVFSSLDQPTTPLPQSESTLLDAAIDGSLRLWDRRIPAPVAKISPPRNTPPWCMNLCWAPDGNTFYAGRRNGTVDEYSLHSSLSTPTRTLRFPGGSGAVTAVRPMPNSRHLVCASFDILRLYDLRWEEADKGRGRTVPFTIVPGHRTGVVSQLFLDRECRWMISTGGNRGWEGTSTEVLLGYEIGVGS